VRILITGGAGFIGSALVLRLVRTTGHEVLIVDKLTYAGNLASLGGLLSDPRVRFERLDICDAHGLRRVFAEFEPESVIHLAAESHVDRSIDGPADFIETNVVGTFRLLEEARRHRDGLRGEARTAFRFVHVSTDEVFGSLGETGAFGQETPYRPSSPYSASKAASDHLARAWMHTYDLPVIVTNCSNNYGPRQYPEKLIPLMILNGLEGGELPVYGAGRNIRDWLFVDDHAAGLIAALEKGRPGETYLFGGGAEEPNLAIVERIADLLDELVGDPVTRSRRDRIRFVPDRPGHDFRYAIDASRAQDELGWRPAHGLEDGLRETVRWYIDNREWWEPLRAGGYRGERLGLGSRS
jgi:dTDP-glucose 4,6-dehydratase